MPSCSAWACSWTGVDISARASLYRLAVARYRFHLKTPLSTAATEHRGREGLLVRLTIGDFTGWGEAAPLPGHSWASLDDVFRELTQLSSSWCNDEEARATMDTASTTPTCLAELMQRLGRESNASQHALGAFGSALAGAFARRAGLPLASWLDPNAAKEVRVNAVLGLGSVRSVVGAAERAVLAGYDTLKLKVGRISGVDGLGDTSGSLSAANGAHLDLELVSQVREALGPSVKIRLDANGAWPSAAIALKYLESLSDFDVEFVEQPVPARDIEAMAIVRRNSPIPIAADESLLIDTGPERVAARRAADVWVIKPTLAGGVLGGWQLAKLARASGASVVVTSALESGIGRTAALHLAASMGTQSLAQGLSIDDLVASNDLAAPWPAPRWRPSSGRVRVPGADQADVNEAGSVDGTGHADRLDWEVVLAC